MVVNVVVLRQEMSTTSRTLTKPRITAASRCRRRGKLFFSVDATVVVIEA
jgi:hypothetical protein